MKLVLHYRAMGKHWFTLHADTFLWLKGNIGLVYNARKNTQFQFSLTKKIEEKCRQLLKTDNLYSISLTDKDIQDIEFYEWIQALISIEAGYLTNNVTFAEKPVSLQPILKIQDKKEHYEWQHFNGKGWSILQNLHELTFYLNGSNYGSNVYYRQHVFPLKDCQSLKRSTIESFIFNSRTSYLCNINLVGNVFSFQDFEKLLVDISSFSIQCTIHVMIQDFLDNMKKIKKMNWPEHLKLNLLVDRVFEVALLQDISLPFTITAFVVSEEDLNQFSGLFESYIAAQKIQIIPLFDGENMQFFESYVLTEKDEIENVELSKNEIFMRQSLNIGDFGKLTVMPDGQVYDNVNAFPLGTVNDSPYSLVYKEFVENGSWFNIREQEPCKDCIYQWLCPSPSNYEIVIKRPNLCHIILPE